MELVAQLVRAPGCGPGGRGFESHQAPFYFDFFDMLRSSSLVQDAALSRR